MQAPRYVNCSRSESRPQFHKPNRCWMPGRVMGASPLLRRSTSVPGTELLRRGSGEATVRLWRDQGTVGGAVHRIPPGTPKNPESIRLAPPHFGYLVAQAPDLEIQKQGLELHCRRAHFLLVIEKAAWLVIGNGIII